MLDALNHKTIGHENSQSRSSKRYDLSIMEGEKAAIVLPSKSSKNASFSTSSMEMVSINTGVAQRLPRRTGNLKVSGSNPIIPKPIKNSLLSSLSRMLLPRRFTWFRKTSLRSTFFVFFIIVLTLVAMISPVSGLRCYVCGGATGRECEDIVTRRWSPYVRPRPVLTSDGKRQWEECNDLINNKGCIKQVVNGGKYNAAGREEWGLRKTW